MLIVYHIKFFVANSASKNPFISYRSYLFVYIHITKRAKYLIYQLSHAVKRKWKHSHINQGHL